MADTRPTRQSLQEMTDEEAGKAIIRKLVTRRGLLWVLAVAAALYLLLWYFGVPLTEKWQKVGAIVAALVLAIFLTWLGTMFYVSLYDLLYEPKADQRRKAREAELRKLRSTANTPHEQISATWDLALETLENFWTANKRQNQQIFLLSVTATTMGFAVLLLGVVLKGLGMGQGGDNVSIIAGVISEFIGATFLIVYRSTVNQTNRFADALERIHAAAMAWLILQTMPEDTAEFAKAKNEARLALILRAAEGPRFMRSS